MANRSSIPLRPLPRYGRLRTCIANHVAVTWVAGQSGALLVRNFFKVVLFPHLRPRSAVGRVITHFSPTPPCCHLSIDRSGYRPRQWQRCCVSAGLVIVVASSWSNSVGAFAPGLDRHSAVLVAFAQLIALAAYLHGVQVVGGSNPLARPSQVKHLACYGRPAKAGLFVFPLLFPLPGAVLAGSPVAFCLRPILSVAHR